MALIRYIPFLFILLLSPLSAQQATTAQAQSPSEITEYSPTNPDAGPEQPSVVTKMAVLAGVALLPFAIMLLTSFVKIVVVLSLLRNAIGVQQTPPNQVINGIALILTVYVMFPTGLAMYDAAKPVIDKAPKADVFSNQSAITIIEIIDKAKEPLKGFLQKNCVAKHIRGFYQLAYRIFPEPYRSQLKPNDLIVLVPSFITSQLKAAFEIGVLIYLPFFVIDLVTSNILLAMGMMMLSPLTIALPIKLLLLVMIDGWTILVQGLTLTFK